MPRKFKDFDYSSDVEIPEEDENIAPVFLKRRRLNLYILGLQSTVPIDDIEDDDKEPLKNLTPLEVGNKAVISPPIAEDATELIKMIFSDAL